MGRKTDLAMSIIGLGMITHMVMPGRETARLIETIGEAYASQVKAMIAVNRRDPTAIDLIIKLSPDDIRELMAYLTKDDIDWLNRQLDFGAGRGNDEA